MKKSTSPAFAKTLLLVLLSLLGLSLLAVSAAFGGAGDGAGGRGRNKIRFDARPASVRAAR